MDVTSGPVGHAEALDKLTLDQLRVLVAVADEGSFSAAARRLRRVQSAVSHAVATLEEQLGLTLFDRETRIPVLRDEGRAVLVHARRVLDDVDGLRRLSADLHAGVDAQVSLVVDSVFPEAGLVAFAREFLVAFPSVQLQVHTETLSAVSALVRDGTCKLGVVGPAADARGLERRHLSTVRMVPVVAAGHPLAKVRGRIPASLLRAHVQIVLGERGATGSPVGTPGQGVMSPRTWRVVDLATKRAFLVGGLGWGNLPEHMIDADVRAGRLVRVRPEGWGDDEHLLSLGAVWLPSTTLGPAARWSLERLAALCSSSPPRRRR